MDEVHQNKHSIPSLFCNWIVQNSWKSIFISLLLIGVVIPGIQKIKSSYTPKVWFDPDHPQIKALNTFEKRFGNDQNIIIGIHHPDGIFQNEVLNEIIRLTNEMWKVTDVIRVESLANYNYIESIDDDIIIDSFLKDRANYTPEEIKKLKVKALNDNIIPNYFLSSDATYALIFGYMRPYFSYEPNYSKVIDDIRKVTHKKNNSSGSNFYILGDAAANDSFREISKKDNKKLIPFMIFFVIVLLILSFRSITGVVLPLLLTVVTVSICFGLMGHMNIIFSSLLAAIPGVMMSICLADSVHILNIYFINRRQGFTSSEATLNSLIENFWPTILTSISTAISFFSISLTDIAPVRGLGILAGIGTITAWLFSYMLLGAIISLLSPLLDRYEMKTTIFEFFKKKLHKGTSKEESLFAKKAVLYIDRHKVKIVIFFSLFTTLSIFIGMNNEVNSDPIKYFHKTVPLRKAYDFAATKLDGLKGVELVVDSEKPEGVKDPDFLHRLDNYIAHLKTDPHIKKVKSIIEIIKKINVILNQNDNEFYKIPDKKNTIAEILFLYTVGLPQGMDLNNQITLDNQMLRMRVIWSLETTKEISKKMKYLVNEAKKFGLKVHVGGNVPIHIGINDIVVTNFLKSMAMAIVLVGILILFVFKDLYISFLSMLPNIIPLMFGSALMALMGKYVDIGTSMVYCVCLGIAVDDTIHFVSHYKIYRKNGLCTFLAIEKIFKSTAKSLTITTALLVAGFGSFIFAEFEPNRNFGLFCAFILSMALITDLIFLPALLLLFDNKDREQSNDKNKILSRLPDTLNS